MKSIFSSHLPRFSKHTFSILNQFNNYLVKVFILLILSVSFSLNLHAAAKSDCPSGAHSDVSINGEYTGSVTDGNKNKAWDSYSVVAPSDGKFSITYTSTYNTRVWFTNDKTNNCRNNRILTSGTSVSKTIDVTANQTIYIQLREIIDSGDTVNYKFILQFTPKNTPPTADAGLDQHINLGDSVILDASGSSDNDGNIVSYLWTEGTTTLSTNQNFTLHSPSAGTHIITLTVTDNQGATDTDTMTITVNTPPVANAGPDQNVLLDTEITLDGSASSDDEFE